MVTDKPEDAGAPEVGLRFGLKRQSGFVQTGKDRHRKPVRLRVDEGAGRRPRQKRVARPPNLNQTVLNGLDESASFQNLPKRARKKVNEKSANHKGHGLGVRSWRTVWVDGPALYALMFGDTH